MWVVIYALTATALLTLSASADYYEFTGTFSFPKGSKGFLPRAVSISGSGVASSSVAPNEIQLAFVDGFTGTLETAYFSTAGATAQAFITNVGDGKFSKPGGSGGLRGKMGFGGLARLLSGGMTAVSWMLTANETKGLGLAGTVPTMSNKNWVRYATWTTGKVVEKDVFLSRNLFKGTVMYGTLSATGFDDRTPLGMGTVQFVTPIRTVDQIGNPWIIAAIGELKLTFAPEPGRAALLVSGALALAVLGVRRTRSRISG